MFVDRYYNNCIEYPKINGELLPYGTLYEYVSSAFVNGFLNYSKPIKAFLIHRYEGNFEVNKQCAKDFNENSDFHTKLWLSDDVILLSKNENNEYWFFWLNHDVSDCCIGRFKTNNSEEQVILDFVTYVLERQKDLRYVEHQEQPIELDVSKITGWVKF